LQCELIFYMAHKTAANQEAIACEIARAGLTLGPVSAATSAQELGYALARAVEHSSVVFLVGGLVRTDGDNQLRVLSRLLDIPLEDDCLRLCGAVQLDGGVGECGWLLESGKQVILSLPDEPAQLQNLVKNRALPYLCRKYGLFIRGRYAEDKLDLELAGLLDPPAGDEGRPAAGGKGGLMRRWWFWLVAALCLAALAAGAYAAWKWL
jgi:hypothetical protein